MYKIILVVCLVLAVARGQNTNVISLSNGYNSNFEDRTDDFIDLNRQQYAQAVQNYDFQIEKFIQLFNERVDVINKQLVWTQESLVQAEERFNPMQLLSNLRKRCVTKYRVSIPTVATIKTAITACATTASSQVNTLLSSARSSKSSLESYYLNYFEKEVKACATKFSNKTSNYTVCVETVISNTNTYMISNQKTFGIQMDAAECSGNAIINAALDCSYNHHSRAISQIAEANVLITNCISGVGECKPCENSCSDVIVVKKSQVDPKSQTMPNPFYGRENTISCLLLNIE